MADNASFRHIGRSVPRKEDDRLLRGYGTYLDDLPELSGTLHLGCVRSSMAHARIVDVDLSTALELPGVHFAASGAHLAPLIRPMRPDSGKKDFRDVAREIIPPNEVRYVGDTVAVILAEDPYVLEDALELVDVSYEELQAVVSIEDALADDAPLVHPEIGTNIPFTTAASTPGFDEAFAAADLVVADTFRSSRLTGMALEPRGCIASYDKGRKTLTMWSSTQVPHLLRSAIAELLDWPESMLRVIAPDVGGGFGPKAHIYPEEILAALLARQHGCTVKWVGDRQDDFLTTTHSRDYRLHLEMALSSDGRIIGLRNRLAVNIGAYPCFPFGANSETGGGAIYMPGAYRFDHYDYEAHAVLTHTAPAGVYRGVAAPVSHFAVEGLLDRAADALGLDPLEIRHRNLVQPHEFPYTNSVGIVMENGSHVECLEKALSALDYYGYRSARAGDLVGDGKIRGIGIACITEHTGQGASRYRARGLHRVPGFEGARVGIEPDGNIVAATSLATQGQGHLTVFAQIVAENLGVDPADVNVVEGDTALSPFGSGTFASRGTVIAGGAAMRATNTLAAKLKRIAAHHLEVSPEDIEMAGGRARIAGVPGAGMTIRELAAIAYSLEARGLPPGENYGLEAVESYDPPGVVLANAVHIACVAVDKTTGRIEVERYVVAHDCGLVINPLLVAGQVHGGIAQGVGQALTERLAYDSSGQILTSQLLDYLIPGPADMPDVTVLHVNSACGKELTAVRGAGEGGVIGAVPAIACAVNDALRPMQARVNRLPLHPEYVHSLMTAVRAAKPNPPEAFH